MMAPDGSTWFLLAFTTPVGAQVYWFNSEGIANISDALAKLVIDADPKSIVVPASAEVQKYAGGR